MGNGESFQVAADTAVHLPISMISHETWKLLRPSNNAVQIACGGANRF